MTVISLGSMKLKFDEKGTPYFERTISKVGEQRKVSMEEAGYVKSLTVDIIIRREGYTPDMRKKVWYGLQKLEYKIPDDEKAYRYCYLVFKPKIMGTVCMSNFDPTLGTHCGLTQNLSFRNELVKKVGKATRLNSDKVKQLMQDQEVIGIFNDDLEQLVF